MASARKNQLSFMNVSSETLWSDIQEFAKLKYQVSVFIKSLQGHWIFLKDWRSHFLQKVFKIKIFFLGCILVNLLGYIKKNLIRWLLLLLFFPCLVKKLVQLGDLLRWFFFFFNRTSSDVKGPYSEMGSHFRFVLFLFML